ncbi:ankyrin : Ankyrin repeat protein OS=Rhodopirellula baltica SH28 GN=RBSH_01420 PE=4 SV=1: DUF2314: Ank_2 [Gemmataceae bacterium]|nr:ankyrin : Ankyrin repeat protein OS=Rhodopirellula baltica SH28 GN=RBSH_01420 PE=4 SV=1: DUF2314: Ank_2 [Gemmataceae bacterium]VTU02403.1 ankyrin : Ankyrin repeat protein OS=Rhodopirellula baltica SH28 GN=RBSH_01420 PE=4 SV=1: DUF2314: Ank_2 [Gemmataceae bacterium]
MSDSQPSTVFNFDGDDPEMLEAYEKARATFRYLWRELTWEYRRIIPALGASAVKAPFSDGPPRGKAKPVVEQMWFGDVFFDGRLVSGTLLNTPNKLRSVRAGDRVSRPLSEISDWLFSYGDEPFGGFTVGVMRSRMSPRERQSHDAAWGMKFGDPANVRVLPDSQSEDEEHPMSENMGPSLKEHLKKDPTGLLSPDENGWTTLHSMALGGSYAAVKILLEFGADPNAPTGNGMTPLQLARCLGWEKVAALLLKHGAK